MGFYGSVEHTVDSKNRIRIPAKFRSGFGKEFYFMARPQGCIGVVTPEELERVRQKLDAVTSGDPKKMMARRVIMGSVERAVEDDQGRILLSASLREHAKITKDVITVGIGDYLEIWALDAFKKYAGGLSIDEAFELVDI